MHPAHSLCKRFYSIVNLFMLISKKPSSSFGFSIKFFLLEEGKPAGGLIDSESIKNAQGRGVYILHLSGQQLDVLI